MRHALWSLKPQHLAMAPRIRQAADALVAELAKRRRFDALSGFAQFLPVTIVAELVGLPAEGRNRMLAWASATFNLFGPEHARAKAAFEDLRDLKAFLDEYGTPDKLKPGGWAQRIFKVGAERSKPELIPNAVEAVVRLATPIRAFTRYAAEDSKVAGVSIPEGARVMVMYASANRGERKFADPDRFDVTRDVHDHLGFGLGVHMCMGMHLAKLEIVSLLRSMARRVKTIALDGTPVVAMNNTIRAWASLPVVVEPDAAGATLAGDPAANDRYRLGILLDPKLRGGSAAVHAEFQPGQVIEIGRPRSNFLLDLAANHTILFAGGIGITPILAMAYALQKAGRSFELHYCGRTASRLALLEELKQFGTHAQVHL